VQTGFNASFAHVTPQCVALRRSDDVEMPDVILVTYDRPLEWQVCQAGVKKSCKLPSARRPTVKMAELVAQHQRLQTFHAIVEANF
jgi:hypothetical protein